MMRCDVVTFILDLATAPCNKLQHTATYCNIHCNTLQHTATDFRVGHGHNTLQHTATQCHTLQHTATDFRLGHGHNTLQHTATYTATHCNTRQPTFVSDMATILAAANVRIYTIPRSTLGVKGGEGLTAMSVTELLGYGGEALPLVVSMSVPLRGVCVAYSDKVSVRNAVCCGVLRCVAVCCGVSRCVVVCCGVLRCVARCCSVVQRAAMCCSVLQCVAVQKLIRLSLRQVSVTHSVCCFVLRCFAVCCGLLRCVAVCCGSTSGHASLLAGSERHTLNQGEFAQCRVL